MVCVLLGMSSGAGAGRVVVVAGDVDAVVESDREDKSSGALLPFALALWCVGLGEGARCFPVCTGVGSSGEVNVNVACFVLGDVDVGIVVAAAPTALERLAGGESAAPCVFSGSRNASNCC